MNELLQWYVIIAMLWCIGYLAESEVGGKEKRRPVQFLWAAVWPVPIVAVTCIFLVALPLAYLWDQAPRLWKRKRP